MDTKRCPIDQLFPAEHDHWDDGPPLDEFKRLRAECPVHWSPAMSKYPDAPGYWSVTRQAEVRKVSRDWETFSSEIGGPVAMPWLSPEFLNSMFIGQDPPKHTRTKELFQRGFTPKRIAQHEDEIRTIVIGVLDRLGDRETCDLVEDVAAPTASRVIGSFMGIDPADDAIWARLMNAIVLGDDPVHNPDGPQRVMEIDVPEIVQRCQALIDARREQPQDDLMTILVQAEVQGERLTDWEIVMGFALLMTGGNDSTKSTFCAGMRALMEHPDQRQMLLNDPSLIPDAVEEMLRMFPPFAHMARTATRDTQLAGQAIKEGERVVMWYPSTGRDESVYEDPDRFDVTRRPEHQAFGAGGRHFCLGSALARLQLRVLFEETLKRYPDMQLDGEPRLAQAIFVNQLTTLPVRLGQPASVSSS